MVAPVILVAVLFIALLISYPWEVLSAGTLVYLALLPLGWFSYRRYQQADAAATRDGDAGRERSSGRARAAGRQARGRTPHAAQLAHAARCSCRRGRYG